MTLAVTNQGLQRDQVVSSRLAMVFCALQFRLALDASYYFYVSEEFATHFLTPLPIETSWERYAQSIGLFLLPLLVLPYGGRDFSALFFLIPIAFLFAPMTSMWGFNAELPLFPVVVAAAAVLVALPASKILRIPCPIVQQDRTNLALSLSGFFLVVFFLWVYMSGAYLNLNIQTEDMYAARQMNSEILDSGVMGHVNLWAEKVFAPFIFIVSLYNKRFAFSALIFGVFIFFAVVTQHRAHLFTPALILFIYLYVRFKMSVAQIYLLLALTMTAALALLSQFDQNEALAVVFRRGFYVPASVVFDWFSYFSYAPHVYWTDKFLAPFLASEYNGQVLPFLVGEWKYPKADLGFNVGIVGSGFAQASVAGVLLYGIVMGALLRLANDLLKGGAPLFFIAALLIGPFRTAWADSDIFASLFSHGLLMGLFVIWLAGSPGYGGAGEGNAGERQCPG